MNHHPPRKIIIIGAGPAGLTAAYEIVKKGEFFPIVFEREKQVGGISCTLNFKGNRIDIGGHRFFSKSNTVMNWWLDILPLHTAESNIRIWYQNQTKTLQPEDLNRATDPEKVMLLRQRKSRILYRRNFFDYPLALNWSTFQKLGLNYSASILWSYLKSQLRSIHPEKNLEDFFINRFGRKLYETFFKSYTEKVWGIACREISSEWGKQRIKGLSFRKNITHFLKKKLKILPQNLAQKNTETSLIERFLYPKYGPGQMWESVSERICQGKGEIHLEHQVHKIIIRQNKVVGVEVINLAKGESITLDCEYLISSMPVRELIRALDLPVPDKIRRISEGLLYRNFITVGVLLKKLKVGMIADNWIYVQEPDVKLGRIQIFNNWSPALVVDSTKIWLGLEYFCDESDEIWNLEPEKMIDFALNELLKINFIDKEDFMDATVIKVPQTYPAYFGTYAEFHEIQAFLDPIENLFLVGRNGMHKYNNQDHSMLTAMQAVQDIHTGTTDKSAIWQINTEQEYHEEK